MPHDSPTDMQAAIDAWQAIADGMDDAEPYNGDTATRAQLQIILDAARERAGMIVPPVLR